MAIVNEALARTYFGDANPIGRRMSIGRDKRRQDMEIVGVVANAKYQTLQEEARRIAYLPVAQHAPGATLFAEVRARGRRVDASSRAFVARRARSTRACRSESRR